MAQGKFWCFTSFDLEINYEAWGADYLIYGIEECPETKKIHHQGYAEWPSNMRINALKKLHGSVHWEKRVGTAEQAIAYCEKDGRWCELGTRPMKKQGARSDIDAVRAMVIAGKGMKDIVEVCSGFQAMRFAEKLLEHREAKRNWKTEVIWLYGPTGTGKTKRAFEEAGPDAWISGKNLKWWQGYDAHEHVIVDDFRGDFCTFHELLRILDRYPYTVEVKGGSRQLLAKKIWITCPWHPSDVYNKGDEEVGQLLRRIDRIINLPKIPGMGPGMEVGGNTTTESSPTREVL